MGSYRPESNFGTSDTVLYQLFTTRFHFSQIPLSSVRPSTRPHARPAASPAVPELSAYPCTPRDTTRTKHSHNTAPTGHIGTD